MSISRGAHPFHSGTTLEREKTDHVRDIEHWAIRCSVEDAPVVANVFRQLADQIEKTVAGLPRACDHKFIDSKNCVKCGWRP
jgi:hypothetical protein